MCGRYSQTHSLKALEAAFSAIASAEFSASFSASYNIAPSQQVAAVRCRESESGSGEQGRELVNLRWGLVPGWMKELPKAAGMINARAETVASKPSFRAAYKRRRCLIPADGFFEWQKPEWQKLEGKKPEGKKEADGKQPYYFQTQDERLFAFAGLWEHWQREGQQIESCTIITTAANADMQQIHERMPLILDPQDYRLWLGEQGAVENADALNDLLRPPDNGLLRSCTVSTHVNNPRHNDARCIEALI